MKIYEKVFIAEEIKELFEDIQSLDGRVDLMKDTLERVWQFPGLKRQYERHLLSVKSLMSLKKMRVQLLIEKLSV